MWEKGGVGVMVVVSRGMMVWTSAGFGEPFDRKRCGAFLARFRIHLVLFDVHERMCERWSF